LIEIDQDWEKKNGLNVGISLAKMIPAEHSPYVSTICNVHLKKEEEKSNDNFMINCLSDADMEKFECFIVISGIVDQINPFKYERSEVEEFLPNRYEAFNPVFEHQQKKVDEIIDDYDDEEEVGFEIEEEAVIVEDYNKIGLMYEFRDYSGNVISRIEEMGREDGDTALFKKKYYHEIINDYIQLMNHYWHIVIGFPKGKKPSKITIRPVLPNDYNLFEEQGGFLFKDKSLTLNRSQDIWMDLEEYVKVFRKWQDSMLGRRFRIIN